MKQYVKIGLWLMLVMGVALSSEATVYAANSSPPNQTAKSAVLSPPPVSPASAAITGNPLLERSYQLLVARKVDESLWHDLEDSGWKAMQVNGEYYLPLRGLTKLFPLRMNPLMEKRKARMELHWQGKSQLFDVSEVKALAGPGAVKPPLVNGLGEKNDIWVSATAWSTMTGMEILPTEGTAKGSLIVNASGNSLRNHPELDQEWQLTARPRVYGYRELTGDLAALRKRYPDVAQEAIGKSSQGAGIPLIKIGTGPKEIFINAAWHGEEWITAQLVANFTERTIQRRQLPEYQALLKKVTLYIAPMINPDGCEIAAHWDDTTPTTLRSAVTALLPQGYPLREWRANAQGYDLNNQFPVHWDRTYELTKNRGPAVGTSGPMPLIATESRQVYDFTLKHQFAAVFCYHSQGEVIYWKDDNSLDTPEMRKIASLYARESGYWRVDNEPLQGGYRDWFVDHYHRPGLTVEVGKGENPLPVWNFPAINERNQRALLACLAALADE